MDIRAGEKVAETSNLRRPIMECVQEAVEVMQSDSDLGKLLGVMQRVRQMVKEGTSDGCNEEWLREQLRQLILEDVKQGMLALDRKEDLTCLADIVAEIRRVVASEGESLAMNCSEEWLRSQLVYFFM